MYNILCKCKIVHEILKSQFLQVAIFKNDKILQSYAITLYEKKKKKVGYQIVTPQTLTKMVFIKSFNTNQ